jgi:class 3 adenylate cyclase
VLNRPVLCSGDFAALSDDAERLESMGEHTLRGFDVALPVYALSNQGKVA